MRGRRLIAASVLVATLAVHSIGSAGAVGVAAGRGDVGANLTDAGSPSFFDVSDLRIVARLAIGGRAYPVSAYISSISGRGEPRRFGPMTMTPFVISGTSPLAGGLFATCSGDATADPDLISIAALCEGGVGTGPFSVFPLGLKLRSAQVPTPFANFVAGTVTQ